MGVYGLGFGGRGLECRVCRLGLASSDMIAFKGRVPTSPSQNKPSHRTELITSYDLPPRSAWDLLFRVE